MEKQGLDDLARGRAMTVDLETQRGADMRYVGQEHAVTVDIPIELFKAKDRDGIKKRFDAVHETRYGYSAPQENAEIVSLRSRDDWTDAKACVGADCNRGPRSDAAFTRQPRRSISPRPEWSIRRPMTASC